jgi:Uma2 family endonuclease
MSISTKITSEEYERMIAEGRFDPSDPQRYELIEGEILTMSPIGNEHSEAVEILNEWSFENRPKAQVKIRVQDAVGIPALDSVPQPDLFWVRRKSYRKARPQASDLLWLVEVSDSTLSYDRGRKSKVYAKAGVADYWIVNIPDQCIEVRRDPKGDFYQSIQTFRAGDVIPLLAFPAITFPVSVLFPDSEENVT